MNIQYAEHTPEPPAEFDLLWALFWAVNTMINNNYVDQLDQDVIEAHGNLNTWLYENSEPAVSTEE